MADFNNSASMLLPIPNVGIAPGPTWADLLNACLTIIDAHTHTAGSGVLITTAAININSDLPINGFNITLPRSVRFNDQPSPLGGGDDLGCIYESQGDLYFNDGLGNQIQITDNGGVAGTPGSISNLTSPASASYVAADSTFVWESDANTPAMMDNGPIIIRNMVASSDGLTLEAPTLSSNYTLTLPQLPSVASFMQLSATGTMSASVAISQGITRANLAPVGELVTTSCGSFSFSSMSFIDATNLTGSFTPTGTRPVVIALSPDGIDVSGLRSDTSGAKYEIQILEDATRVAGMTIGGNSIPAAGVAFYNPNMSRMYTPTAGAKTYKVQVKSIGGDTAILSGYQLQVYEL